MPLELYQHPAGRARAAVGLWGARRWYGVRSPREPSCQFVIDDTEFEMTDFDNFGEVTQYVRCALAKNDLLRENAARDVSRDA